jgi:hypothetical protein
MKVPPERFITSGSAASAAMILPGNSTELPTALLSCDAMPETFFRFSRARSV